jgi:hypothetical protein
MRGIDLNQFARGRLASVSFRSGGIFSFSAIILAAGLSAWQKTD